ncbi:MAG: transglutaminase [Candidatus Eisenbacteria bacterium]|nr:transglutaminase [Candidatus Eisenbacteria bacterium]
MKRNRLRPARRAALALALLFLPVAAFAAIGDTLQSFPAPSPCPTGLALHRGSLWSADWETGKLYETDRSSGALRGEIEAPCHRPEGLASDGELLYVADYESALIFGLDTETGLTVRSFPSPESAPRGLAFGGGSLWILDDGTDRIYEASPEDGTILNYYAAPHKYCRGLAHDGERLWVTDRILDELYAVRPSDGAVLFLVKTPGPFPVGLAFGEGALWLSDFGTRRIHRLRTRADLPYRVTDEITRDIRFRHVVRNEGEGTITETSIRLAVPADSLENQSLVDDILWEPEPDRFTADRWGQPIALFGFRDVPPGGEVSAGYRARVRLGEVHYAFYPEDVGGLDRVPREIAEPNLAPTSRLQMDRELVRATAREIVGDETNPYWIARKIFDWVRDKLEYERVGGWDVPTTLIQRGTGSCSEYAFLYIALCRAAGLPARYEASVVVRGDDASIDDVYHRWCEVYLPGVGWFPVDPSGGDNEWPADQARYFGGLSNRFLITTHGGGDSEYLGWDYNAHAVWTYRGRGAVRSEGYGVWSPVEERESGGDAAETTRSTGD